VRQRFRVRPGFPGKLVDQLDHDGATRHQRAGEIRAEVEQVVAAAERARRNIVADVIEGADFLVHPRSPPRWSTAAGG